MAPTGSFGMMTRMHRGDRTAQPSSGQRLAWSRALLVGPQLSDVLCWSLPLPAETTGADIAAIITGLHERHPALRRRIQAGPDGPQLLEATVVEVDVPPTIDEDPEAVRDWAQTAADLARPSALLSAVSAPGTAAARLWLASHAVMLDAAGAEILGAELLAAVGRTTAPEEPGSPAAPSRETTAGGPAEPAPDDAGLEHWRSIVAEPAARVPLSHATPAPAEPPTATLRLDPPTHQALFGLATTTGAAVATVLRAALAVVVHRIGTPVPRLGLTRSRPDDGLAGPGALEPSEDDVAVDVALDDRLSAAALIRRLAEAEARAAALPSFRAIGESLNVTSPFVEFVSARTRARRRPDQPIRFHRLDRVHRPVLAIAPPSAPGDTELMTVTLNAEPGAGPADLLRFGHRVAQVLAAMAADPERPVVDLSVLLPDERAHVVTGFNDRAVAEEPLTLPDLVERQVDRTPTATAVVCGPEALTYAELDERSNRLARVLIARDIGTEDIVALAMPRRLEQVVAMLAVAKSGAAFLPLDIGVPEDRLAFIVADAAPAALLVAGEPAERPWAGQAPILDLTADAGRAEVAAASPRRVGDGDRRRPLYLDNACYVIYTSGSTGRPKGVVVQHTGVQSVIRSVSTRLRIREGSRVVQLASPSFDVVVWDTCSTLFVGGTLILVPPETNAFALWFPKLVAEHRATHVTMSPTAADTLDPRDPRLASLAMVVVGEKCTAQTYRRWSWQRQFNNGYGPTEVTICSALGDPQSAAAEPTVTAPHVGYTLDNVANLVLGGPDGLDPVPIGAPGVLHVAGVGLARGYLGRPDLTAASFRPNPFGPAGSRVYCTGDLVRWRADGLLDFVRRIDDQVKIRGFRVEPGEVEAAIVRSDDVGRAVVLAVDDKDLSHKLVAFVVPAGDGLDPADVRERVGRLLPDYMVPSSVVVVDSVPQSPSGKLDRSALLALVG